jgi:2-polyprenyl-3-methyl-5-hydroxy-6-metoxy-1,4-benzoquinol methylase
MDPAGKRDVLATDGAESMLDVARIRVKEAGLEGVVRFRKVDVTSKEDLVGLVRAEGKWDVVLMNMALMDVGEVWILAKTLPHLLRKGGV